MRPCGSVPEGVTMERKIEYAELEKFCLDPANPRLGRSVHQQDLSKDDILERMKDWSLEELATSFLESGFWAHEAVLCLKDADDGRLIVVEGNRRIAALMQLQRAFQGVETSKKWRDLIANAKPADDLFHRVPYIRLKDRSEVDAFLGFRHVTGIKEWAPTEKAQFIAKLIDENNLSYREVMRRIGSKTETVQRNYIAYSILLQMEDTEGLDASKVEDKFSVLFLSLRVPSVQDFLGVREKFHVPPDNVNPPISDDYIANMKDYAKWLFGDEETPPVVTDSRFVDRFARVLASDAGLEYMRSVPRPSLEKALVIARGGQEEVYELISTAAYSVEESLSSIHHYAEDEQLIKMVKRLVANVKQLNRIFNID